MKTAPVTSAIYHCLAFCISWESVGGCPVKRSYLSLRKTLLCYTTKRNYDMSRGNCCANNYSAAFFLFLPWRQIYKENLWSFSKRGSRGDGHTVNEDVEGRIWNMWAARKQDESRSRNAAVSNTIQPICGSRGIRHTTIKRVRWLWRRCEILLK